VEDLCHQIRVIRHLQTAEKEGVVEKIHEIEILKTELSYVKKIWNKYRTVRENRNYNFELSLSQLLLPINYFC